MPPGARRHLALLLKLGVAIALTAIFVHYASPSRILLALRAADPWLVATFVPLTPLCMLLAALQLKVFTDSHGMNVSLRKVLHINAATEFYNLFLPGIVAGGAIRWYRLSRGNQMRAQALAVISLNRILNLVVLLTFGIVGWLLQDEPPTTEVFAWFLAACLAMLAGLVTVLCSPRLHGSLGIRAASRRWVPSALEAWWLKVVNALGDYQRIPLPERVKLLAYLVGWQLAILASIYLFSLALALDVGIGTIAWIRAMLGLALMLPITIAGFGLREGGWIFFLGFHGVAPAEAFALSLLTFLRTLFQALIGVGLEIHAMFWRSARG